ncbi:restriction endonuclease [Planctomycetota bacterium]
MEVVVILVLLFVGVSVLGWLATVVDKAKQFDDLQARKPRLLSLEQSEKELYQATSKLEDEKVAFHREMETGRTAFIAKNNRDIIAFHQEMEAVKATLETETKEARTDIQILASQKANGFPWLAQAYSDYFKLKDRELESHLRSKAHPAVKASEIIKETNRLRREAQKDNRILNGIISYYETLFPWLEEFKIDDISDEESAFIRVGRIRDEKDEDNAQNWLTPEEYEKLPDAEKYQRALDRYVKKRKSKWEIGRDYERYIGFKWEREGFRVKYLGIVKGFEDMGRDLLAENGKTIHVIQCKCWSQHKTIHEKHVFQLFGTTIEYWLQRRLLLDDLDKSQIVSLFDDRTPNLVKFIQLIEDKKITPIFVTSTALSDLAREIADTLHVRVIESMPLEDYPRIKCNVSTLTGERIYHLPFDQQYDKIVIEPEKGEFYAETVAEAEEAGFRRAFRWRGKTT